ncbi:Uncharacterized conserved protein YggE, contains kinase-interacting SIMPL domain [Rhizobiales bacterium GAS191]|jgi:uncharacterized protein YggE|nr:Uncharacterized conserved protein YggE, contains kinase-interacting SIMPL domain [Rhizobiales bacterium GAS113]SEC29904.1 Uncharacterized conserved protein YggE, contains kinase-interacting SIMPL domain [Rhizobiales bacterium GAS191]
MRKAVFALSILAATLTSLGARAQPAVMAQASGRPVLTVEGNGRAEAKPDQARLSASVSGKAATLEAAVEASQNVATRAEALLQSLKGEGLEVERSNFSLAENRPPYPVPGAPQAAPPTPSYTATTTYSLKIGRLDRLNAVIGKLASSGLLEMHAVSFSVLDERNVLDEARRKAVADARHQAETLADAAGVRLDEIVTISNTRATPRSFAAAGMAAPQSVEIVPPDTLGFDASVVMSWHISSRP